MCHLSRREFLQTAGSVLAAGSLISQLPAAEPEPAYQIGCYTRVFDQYEYRVALDCIAEAGYTHCGIMTAKGNPWMILHAQTTDDDVARLAEEIKKRSLKVISVCGGSGFSVAKSIETGVAGLRRRIDHAVTLGSNHLMIGSKSEQDKLYRDHFKAVAECCDYAAAKGVVLSIKPHGGETPTGPECRRAVDLVGHKNFRVWYDPGNIMYYSEGKLNPAEDVACLDGHVAGMSVKDCRMPKDVMLTPGAGLVDFAKVLARLKTGGFVRGPLVVECTTRGEIKQTIEEARKARKFLEQLVVDLR